ncbi:hypothetical protein LA52FAK_36280 [Desulforhopalus sp. 52FAK]
MWDSKTKQLFHALVVILAIDAFRTLFESFYFGLWYTSLSGLIPLQIGEFLTRPELVIIPKIINVIAAVIIIILLLKRWLPKEEQEHNKLGAALHDSEEEFRAFFENNPVSCWLEDFSKVQKHFEDLRERGIADLEVYIDESPEELVQISQAIEINDVNQATLDLHKAESKDQLFQGLEKTFTPESFETFRKEIVDLWNGKIQNSYDGVVKTLDDELRYVKVSYKILPGYENTLKKVLITLVDNTSKWLAEQQLLVSQNRFDLAMQFTNDGLYDWNLETNEIWYSSGWKKMLGYEPDELENNFSLWERLTHPDDTKASLQMLNEVIDRKRARFEIEIKMKHKNGDWVDILSRANVVFNDEGKAERVVGTHVNITERKARDKELKSLVRDQNIILDNVPNFIIFKDTQNTILKVTNSVALMTGLPKNEIEGRPSKEVYPDMVEKYWEDDLEVIRTGQPKLGFVEPLPTADGKTKWLLTDKIPYFEDEKVVGILVISTDISERVESERQLKESEMRFRSLFENAADAIYVVSMEGKILDVNSVAQKQTGFSKKELLSMDVRDLDPRTIEDQDMENIWENIDLGGIATLSTHHIRKDNSQIPVEISLTRYKFKEDIFLLAFVRDVTEKVETERQLQQAQKMESIGNLAGGIAHDFNNILSSIIGFTELAIEAAPEGSTQREDLKEVYIAGNRAKELVQQILAFARQSEKETKPVRLNDIITEALKLLRPSTPTTIDIKPTIDNPVKVTGNSSQLHQIVMNLCTNAIYSLEESGGVLEIDLRNIFLNKDSEPQTSKLPAGEYVELTVSDNGPGIDPTIIENIFEPYFTTKGVGEGSGMGLAMVKGIVESYGGDIKVQSVPGKKTSFAIRFPVATGKKYEELEQIDRAASGTERILFVDDEPPIARMGSRMLESLGYTVTIRTSSFEALELFKEKPDTFDLVITDMTMPSMTGDQLSVEMRKIRHDILIILCTGYSNTINDESAKQIGIDAFVYKPLTKADLAKTIREVLDDC